MKNKRLKTKSYLSLEKGYREWLAVLGYAQSTVYTLSNHLVEFLEWQEQKGKTKLPEMNVNDMLDFIKYFRKRPNKRRAGGLSITHINRQIESLKKLTSYLKQVKGIEINLSISYLKKNEISSRIILTKQEIEQLYAACANNVLGDRDRAMLGIYYGCGLRKSEGVNLDIGDLFFDRKLLIVSKSKTGRQRKVPIALSVLQDLEQYVYESRSLLLGERENPALFISERGKRIQGQSLYIRLKQLVKKAKLNKQIGLHSLRHSIATHLQESGMQLEDIGQFLGHRSLDSTQIYTK